MPHGPDRTPPEREGEGADAPFPGTFESRVLTLLPSLRRYSRSLTRSDPDGDDLVQDCVEKVLRRRAQWQGTNLKAWVFTIMTNLYRNGRRHAAGHATQELGLADGIAADDPFGDPLARDRLARALDALEPDYRAVLMLVVVEGYRYQEVATMLDIPMGTVMSRLSRARQRLGERFADTNVVPLRRP